MKSILTALAIVLSIAAASSPVSAARIGAGTLDPVGPTPYEPGEWRARVKYVDPHRVGSQYYTYSYLDIVASTQQGCEQQLASMGSVTVLEYCHFVAY